MNPDSDSKQPKGISFFDYLKEKKLYYTLETIENFLLSIKVKPFMIMSGGTGTGKTKLAQAYGMYLSNNNVNNVQIKTEVTLNKAETNNGFTLSADDFFNNLPYDGRRADGQYIAKLGDLETTCTIRMSPRMWYRPNVDAFKEEVHKLKEQGKEKETLYLTPISDKNGSNYELIPVGSNWTESRFIIGYKNVLTEKYATTPSLDLIVKANQNPTKPFLLILDEMNLSHVERYFSEILSAMESNQNIKLDSDGAEIPKEISIGDNLIMIGTINADETTYAFSPKVLDRANVLEFESKTISEMLSGSENDVKPDGNIEYLENCMAGIDVRDMKAIDVKNNICSNVLNVKYIEELVADLESLRKEMESIGLSFGFRTVDEIFRFMYAAWIYKNKGEFTTWKRFFDAQIKQKILPKIHGNLSIRKGLESMLTLCSNKGYITSAKKLETMINKLDNQRYVSFNS